MALQSAIYIIEWANDVGEVEGIDIGLAKQRGGERTSPLVVPDITWHLATVQVRISCNADFDPMPGSCISI